MSVKFGENRTKNKKVSGTVYFPGQGRQYRGAGLRRGQPAVAWLATRRLPRAPVDENLKVAGFASNFAGGTSRTHGPCL